MDDSTLNAILKDLKDIKDAILGPLDGSVPGMRQTIQDHEKRLRLLEEDKSDRDTRIRNLVWKAGAAATLGGLLALLIVSLALKLPIF